MCMGLRGKLTAFVNFNTAFIVDSAMVFEKHEVRFATETVPCHDFKFTLTFSTHSRLAPCTPTSMSCPCGQPLKTKFAPVTD